MPAGLENVTVTHSAITRLDGERGELDYRGFPAAQLARTASFEQVAWLLWHGELPAPAELAVLRAGLGRARAEAAPALAAMRALPPTAHPLEALRAAVTTLAASDPARERIDRPTLAREAVRLTALMPLLAGAWHRLRRGREPAAPHPGDGSAAALLHALNGAPPAPGAVRALDACLVLHADHELNASTFAARVVAATEADLYSAVVAALAALKGPKHGGANQDVTELLDLIGAPERAEQVIMPRIERYRALSPEQRRGSKERFPAFGHRVYKVDDPRAALLREIARRLCAEKGDPELFEAAERVRAVIQRELRLPVNVDFYSAVLYRALDIPPDLCTAVFAVARTAGWTAHVMEQLSANRLIRPRAEYVGPPTRLPPGFAEVSGAASQ